MTVNLDGVYHEDIQKRMRNVYDSLSEKDRRRYAAAEAIKLGYGGVAYIARLFECSRESIDHGMEELDQLPDDPVAGRIRRQGAGRKVSLTFPDWQRRRCQHGALISTGSMVHRHRTETVCSAF